MLRVLHRLHGWLPGPCSRVPVFAGAPVGHTPVGRLFITWQDDSMDSAASGMLHGAQS